MNRYYMKKLLLFILAWMPFFTVAQTSDKTLINADIIKLAKLDLPSAAIISKIKNSPTHFDVGVDALVELKSKGVSGEVISEMIDASSHEQKAVAGRKDMRDPATMRKEGIYYFNRKDSSHLFVPIDPTVVSHSKSGGFGIAVAQHYSYGIAKASQVSSLSGAHSRRQISHTKPRFYFYFNATNTISPNEFALVKLTEKKTGRTMVVGSSNSYGQSIGVNEKQKVDFNYDQVAEGVYKVYPKQPLEDGEYCFLYTGSAPTLFSENKVYDFGINTEREQ
jgi:hypothetical protein